jgi:hypothetical protein
MSLLCIYCDREAKYLFEGTSLCKEHLDSSMQIKMSNPETIVINAFNAPEVPEF